MMRANRFRYHPVRSVAQALHILAAEGPAAMLLAGGTDLVPNMKRRQQTPAAVIGLRGVPELRGGKRGLPRRCSSSARTIFSGVIGTSSTRTPSASNTAFASAGMIGRSGPWPTSFAPNGPFASGSSTR